MSDQCRNPLHQLNYKPSNWKQQTNYRTTRSEKITEYFYTEHITKNEDQV